MTAFWEACPAKHLELVKSHDVFATEGNTFGLTAQPAPTHLSIWRAARWQQAGLTEPAMLKPPPKPAGEPESKVPSLVTWEERVKALGSSTWWEPGAIVFLKWGQNEVPRKRIVVAVGVYGGLDSGKTQNRAFVLLWRYECLVLFLALVQKTENSQIKCHLMKCHLDTVCFCFFFSA